MLFLILFMTSIGAVFCLVMSPLWVDRPIALVTRPPRGHVRIAIERLEPDGAHGVRASQTQLIAACRESTRGGRSAPQGTPVSPHHGRSLQRLRAADNGHRLVGRRHRAAAPCGISRGLPGEGLYRAAVRIPLRGEAAPGSSERRYFRCGRGGTRRLRQPPMRPQLDTRTARLRRMAHALFRLHRVCLCLAGVNRRSGRSDPDHQALLLPTKGDRRLPTLLVGVVSTRSGHRCPE